MVNKSTLRASQTTRMGARGSQMTLDCKTQRFGEPIKGPKLQPTCLFLTFTFTLTLSLPSSSLSSSQISLVLKPKKSFGFPANPETALAPSSVLHLHHLGSYEPRL